MVAITALGARIDVPLGPVPLSLQTYAVLLAGFVLGPGLGALAMTLYLALGASGLPVFADGTSGLERLTGPTGGFLWSFIAMAILAGAATRGDSRPLEWKRGIAFGALATVASFALGVPWLKLDLDMAWRGAVVVGMLPFLPGAVIKLALAVATHRLLARRGLLPRSV